MGDKSELRKILKQRILEISDKAAKDKVIEQNLLKSFPHLINKNILAYKPMPGEPNLINYFQELKLSNNVLFANYKDLNMIGSDGEISDDFSKIEIAFIPALGFTNDGFRLGRGGGWYDRAIAQMTAECIKIGVCYEDQLIDTFEKEEFDMEVDRVVTENFK